MQISPHFNLAELARTDIRRYILPNIAALETDPRALAAIKTLCVDMLESLRAHFDAPVIIHSGYRSPGLNVAVGGVSGSQHSKGEAADFHVSGYSLQQVFDWIKNDSGFKFGQLILEGRPSWIHLSLGEPFRDIGRCREMFRAVPDERGEMRYSRIT